MANTGCHSLLEFIFPASLATSSPEYPVRPEPLRPKHCLHTRPSQGKPQSSRAASGANPTGRPTTAVEIKPQLEPRGSVAKERDPEPSHHLGKLQVQSQDRLGRRGLWTLCEATESAHRRKRARSDSRGQWTQGHTGVGPEETLSCPHSGSRDQHRVGGHPREASWTGTPSEGKDSDSGDSRKAFILLMFWLVL